MILVMISFGSVNIIAWSNGGYSDEPSIPDYGTHDWIAEHALDWLPKNEKQYISEDLNQYLYATELPDNPAGYGDTFEHHVYYRANGNLQENDSAVRAKEEYVKALQALQNKDYEKARKYAGAMTHYIADMAVFGHVMGADTDWGAETHHSDYEDYVNERTDQFNEGTFENYLEFDGDLENISAYQATLDLAYDTTFDVDGDYDCLWMDAEVGVNHAPMITSMSANPITVEPGEASTISVSANDQDNDDITYDYSVNGGTISGSGSSVTWIAPSTTGDYSITVEVSDGELTDSETVSVSVEDEPQPTGHLMINEFEQNPSGTDDGNEWVELYNPTGSSIDLTDWKLHVPDTQDADQLLSGSISSGGYKVITFPEQWLDNSDEWVSLMDNTGTTVDKTPTKDDSENDGRSWQRYPNGKDTDSTSDWDFRPSSKGSSNGGTRSITRGYNWEDTAFVDRVGESLNFAVNLIADVLHHLAWESGYVGQSISKIVPHVEASSDVTSGNLPLEVSFTADGTDSDGSIISYEWYFPDDDTTMNGNEVSHTFTIEGTFEVNVTVTDDNGSTAFDNVKITVLPREITGDDDDDKEKDDNNWIVGLCIGGVIFGVIILVILYLIGRNVQKTESKPVKETKPIPIGTVYPPPESDGIPGKPPSTGMHFKWQEGVNNSLPYCPLCKSQGSLNVRLFGIRAKLICSGCNAEFNPIFGPIDGQLKKAKLKKMGNSQYGNEYLNKEMTTEIWRRI